MSFSKLAVAKFVASGVVALGTSKIVKSVIAAHVKPETLLDKVTVTAAAWVISGIATTRTQAYTDETVEKTVENVTNVINKLKINSKIAKINEKLSTFEKEGLDPDDFEEVDGKWKAKQKTPSDKKTVDDGEYVSVKIRRNETTGMLELVDPA